MERIYQHRELFRGIADKQGAGSYFWKYMYKNAPEDMQFRISLITSEDTASYVVSRLRTGVSSKGNPWSRWEDMANCWVSAKPTKSGNRTLRIYGKQRTQMNKGFFGDITSDIHELKSTINNPQYMNILNQEIFRLGTLAGLTMPAVPEYDPLRFGEPSLENIYERREEQMKQYSYACQAIYPMIGERFTENRFTHFKGMSYGARATTNMDYTLNLFGKKNYRKDLVKAVANTGSIENLLCARQYRNLVPTDWIVKYLQDTQEYDAPEFLVQETRLRKVLQKLTLIQRRRLLKDCATNIVLARYSFPSYTYNDTLKMAVELSATALQALRFKTWQEFHDQLVPVYQDRQSADLEIPVTPAAKKIMDVEPVGGIRFILPESTRIVNQWGREMGHCIGSYALNALNGYDVLLGVMKEDKMIGNIQVDIQQRKVPQVLGKYNAILPREDRLHIAKMLTKSKVLREDWIKSSYGMS